MSRLTKRLVGLDRYLTNQKLAQQDAARAAAEQGQPPATVHPIGNRRQRQARAAQLRQQSKELARKEMARQQRQKGVQATQTTEDELVGLDGETPPEAG